MAGLSMHRVLSVAECARLMERGWNNRSTGATLMNADSSRSHSIFTIYIERVDEANAAEQQAAGANAKKEHIRAGKLNLVDLAGSERQSKTGASFFLFLSFSFYFLSLLFFPLVNRSRESDSCHYSEVCVMVTRPNSTLQTRRVLMAYTRIRDCHFSSPQQLSPA